MTRAEIQAFFPSFSPGFIAFGGMNYAVPTLEWLTEGFGPWFLSELGGAGVGSWSVKWQCRDFARAYACMAQLENAKSGTTPAGEDALSVGEFWFHPDANPPGEDHAICACIADGSLVFIEPQTGKVRPMSANEIASCRYLRF